MIGRKQESASLQRFLDSKRAEIIVVYGRRRVGKTFLVNEFFSNSYAFKHTAVSLTVWGSEGRSVRKRADSLTGILATLRAIPLTGIWLRRCAGQSPHRDFVALRAPTSPPRCAGLLPKQKKPAFE